MKRIFTLLVLMLNMTIFAQVYIPIPESNAVWIQGAFLYSSLGHEHVTITQPLASGPDSTISGMNYHSVTGHQLVEWIDNWGSQQNYQTGQYSTATDTFYFRQDIPAKKIYAWYGNSDTLLYDFDLTIGQSYPQTMTNYFYPDLLVMGQDSILLLDGVYHKRWALGTEPADSGYITLIEGVGSSLGFNLPLYPLFEQSGAILCFKDNGNQVYENWGPNALIAPHYSEFCEANVSLDELVSDENGLKLWPNPASGSINIVSEKDLESIKIVDTQGRVAQLETGLSKGTTELNVDNLFSGSYILYVQSTDGSVQVRKITIN